jgi:MFS family permease
MISITIAPMRCSGDSAKQDPDGTGTRVTTADIRAAAGGGRAKPVLALGVTQMTAWGTTYYLPAVFTEAFQRDLGLSATAVFSGVAIMLISSALLAWPAGRLMDRNGAGRSMPAGSLLLALGLLALGLAQGFWSYALAWLLFGLGMSLAMSNAMLSALAQIAGSEARRSMVLVMLFGAMAATVFWPLSLWLENALGWRGVCFIYAAAHALVCAPLHALVLARATAAGRRRDRDADELSGLVPPRKRRLAALLVVIAVSGNGFVSWGLDLHLIAILKEFGLTASMAVIVAAWKGPANMASRALDILFAGRVTPMASAMAAGVLMPVGIALPILWTGGVAAGILFITVYGFGTGLMTIARATLPLTLLGAQGYAVTIGRFTLPTQIVYALSPMAYGYFLDRLGLAATLWIALAASLLSCAALAGLTRMARPTA